MRGRFMRRVTCVAFLFWLTLCVMWPAAISADEARYFYDELGRLAAVVDGQGNVAVYTYDAAGNLISIQRFPAGGSGGAIGIFFFSPSSALVATTVQLRGFGFSPTASANQVKFNGALATVVSATANSIVTTVPADATTGPITITNTNGTATSPQPFTVLVPPIISGVNPNLVPQGVTTRLIIAGFNLAEAATVTFSNTGLVATILSGATSQNLPINLFVGSSVPDGPYTFTVATPAGVAQSGIVTVAVTSGVPGFTAPNSLSVFMP